ncbi:hypothetical protein MUG91_G2n265 [Manis pentadactyla]|nr:hypothetical protein MUG91_G2n265 [Manis pentadactyla]
MHLNCTEECMGENCCPIRSKLLNRSTVRSEPCLRPGHLRPHPRPYEDSKEVRNENWENSFAKASWWNAVFSRWRSHDADVCVESPYGLEFPIPLVQMSYQEAFEGIEPMEDGLDVEVGPEVMAESCPDLEENCNGQVNAKSPEAVYQSSTIPAKEMSDWVVTKILDSLPGSADNLPVTLDI